MSRTSLPLLMSLLLREVHTGWWGVEYRVASLDRYNAKIPEVADSSRRTAQ